MKAGPGKMEIKILGAQGANFWKNLLLMKAGPGKMEIKILG